MGVLKAIWATSIIFWHIFSSAIGKMLIRDPRRRREFYLKNVSRSGRWMLRALAIQLEIEGSENTRPAQNYLIVSNHLSYLDAVIISAFRPSAFVTSIEMRAVPVLGLVTELGGCLYVERRNKENIINEVEGISEALRQGFNVVVFPEATSTNGSRVLPFKRPLFTAAAKALVPVLPAVIQYEEIDGKPVTSQNRDYLCWYGDMGFGLHFLRIASLRSVRIRLKVLPEIPVTAESTRDTLMDEAFVRISGHYRPIV